MSSGINIEGMHLADIKRIERFFSLVMVAFSGAYLVVVFANAHVKPIRILNNGKRAKSIFKYGLEIIVHILSNPIAKMDCNIGKFL